MSHYTCLPSTVVANSYASNNHILSTVIFIQDTEPLKLIIWPNDRIVILVCVCLLYPLEITKSSNNVVSQICHWFFFLESICLLLTLRYLVPHLDISVFQATDALDCMFYIMLIFTWRNFPIEFSRNTYVVGTIQKPAHLYLRELSAAMNGQIRLYEDFRATFIVFKIKS